MTDWESVKERYLSTGATLKEIAGEFGISYETLRKRAKRENWTQERKKKNSDDREVRIERVTELLLSRMEAAIDKCEEMDSKEIKAMTGALKELRELQKQGSGDNEGGARIEVCFMGETEELSR